ncbi:MAG: O-antigen ligase family protein [Pirellulaceae bacterium]
MARSRKRPTRPVAASIAEPQDHWILAGFTFLLTVTTLLPTESIGDDSLSLLVLLWLLGGSIWIYVHWKHQRDFIVGRLDWWWAIAALFVLIGAISNIAHGDARRGFNATFAWCVYPLVFFMARDVLRCQTSKKAVAAWMIALAVGLSSCGLYQYFVGMPAFRAEFGALSNVEEVSALTEIGINPDASSAEYKQFLDRLESTEPYSTFGLANSLAGFLVSWSVMAVPAIVFLVLGTGSTKPTTSVSKWFLLCGAAIVAMCIMLTKSRSAWLALAAGGLAMSWLTVRPTRRRWTLVLGAFGLATILLAVGVAVGAVDSQVLTEARVSMAYRLQYWRATLNMIQDHWFFGVGAGNFQSYYTQYKWPQASEVVADPHQFLLELWATLGLVPFICVFAYFGRRLVDARRDIRSRETESPTEPTVTESPVWTIGGRLTPFAAVLCGGVAACFASVLCRLSFQQNVEMSTVLLLPVVWVIVLPISMFTFWHLRSWVTHGHWCRWWCLVAVGTLAINLTAAGGISYAAVAVTIWLLLAMSDERAPAEGSRRWSLVALVGLALVFAPWFALTTLHPILQRRGHLLEFRRHMDNFQVAHSVDDMATSHRHWTQADTSLQAAIRADEKSPVPPRFLAVLSLRKWGVDQGSEETFREALDLMVSKDPLSQRTRFLAAKLALAAYTETEDPDWLDRVIRELAQGVELYPNDAMSYARLAWGYHLSDRDREAAIAANLALRLDAKHDHIERKLARQHVVFLHLPPWELPPPNRTSAEQTMQQLRIPSRN